MESCSILKLEFAGAERWKILVGEEFYGMVGKNEFGRFCARGRKPGAEYGASPREAAVKLVVRDCWADIKAPVMEAARKADADNEAMILSMIEKGVLSGKGFEHLMLKEAA